MCNGIVTNNAGGNVNKATMCSIQNMVYNAPVILTRPISNTTKANLLDMIATVMNTISNTIRDSNRIIIMMQSGYSQSVLILLNDLSHWARNLRVPALLVSLLPAL